MKIRLCLLGLASFVSFDAGAPAQELSEIRALRDEGTSLMKARQMEQAQAKRDEALRLARRAIELREKKLGAESPELIPFLKIAGQLSIAGEMRAAAEKAMKNGGAMDATATPISNGYYQRALKIAEKAYGSDHPETADALDGYATRLGKATEARELMERAQNIRRRHFGEDSPECAKSLLFLCGWHTSVGDDATARDLLERALALFERTLKVSDLERFGEYLDLLPIRYLGLKDFEASRKAQQRVAAIRVRLGKDGHEDDLKVLASQSAGITDRLLIGEVRGDKVLASQSVGITDPRELIPIHERLLAAEEKKYGTDTIYSFGTLSFLSAEYRRTGDLDKAARAIDRLLAISRKKPGEFDALALLGLLVDAANFYEFFGDYEKAQPLRLRMLELAEGGVKGTGDALQVALICAARNHRALGDREKAETCFARAFALPWPEPTSPMGVLLQLEPLAELRFEHGDYDQAEELYMRFTKIINELKLGAMPYNGDYLHHLGLIAHSRGRLDEAADFFRQARAIFAASPPNIPGVKTETATSPSGLLALAEDEAVLALERGLLDEALTRTAEVETARRERVRKLLAFGSERQRLALQASFDPYAVLAAADHPLELARSVLRYKGLVLDSLIEDRRIAERANEAGQGELYEELRRSKQTLAQAEFSASVAKKSAPKSDDPRPALTAKVEELQNRIATKVAGLGQTRRALEVTIEQVQQSLPVGGALVEFIRYRHPISGRKFEARYGALVLTPVGEPRWVPFGSAEELEKTVVLYQKSTRGKTDEATLQRVVSQLFNQVWKPLAAVLPPGTKTLAISPDGALNSISFAALADGAGRFLAEDFSIRYVASGRDLLPEKLPAATGIQSFAIFANPTFHTNLTTARIAVPTEFAMRALDRSDLGQLSLPALPGTAREADGLVALASAQGWKTETHLESGAREATLAQLHSPRVLHLATHGFILPDSISEEGGVGARPILRNPMLRSGLALAAAQDTLDAWKAGKVPSGSDDGIVTAEEVGTLHLEGTWLVTLSACDTGSGEARAGEGVLGLRRGFIQAGAQNLLMTLWPISDQTTVQIMLDFYESALKGANAPQALSDTQRDWLVKLRKERGLLAAVQLAGPFIMSSQGREK